MMTTALWFALTVAAVLGWYLSFSASRLDRLHHRVETSWAALDAALQRRAGVALELASSGLVDPASSVVLTAAAHDAREAEESDRASAETDLTQALSLVLPEAQAFGEWESDRLATDLMEEFAEAARRVQFAHVFHADAVESTRIVRRKAIVRFFRLAGRASVPTPFDAELGVRGSQFNG
jgi:hypothetical protein